MTRIETDTKLVEERIVLQRYMIDIQAKIDEINNELTELRV